METPTRDNGVGGGAGSANQAGGGGRGLIVLMVVAAGVFVLALVSLYVLNSVGRGPGKRAGSESPVVVQTPASSDPSNPDERVSQLFIPSFSAVDQDNKPVNAGVFRGKVSVVEFFFTSCPFICPMMNGKLQEIAGALKDVPEVQLVSFSVDPEHDTPAVLKDYGVKHEADFTKWKFVTGKREVIWNILIEGMKWAIEERPEQPITLPSGSKMNNIRHPGWFALIGPDSKVLAIYKFDVPEDLDRLKIRVKQVATAMRKK